MKAEKKMKDRYTNITPTEMQVWYQLREMNFRLKVIGDYLEDIREELKDKI